MGSSIVSKDDFLELLKVSGVLGALVDQSATRGVYVPQPLPDLKQIGMRYRIPFAYGAVLNVADWWPAVGRVHVDEPFVGADAPHVNVDWRFVADAKLASLGVVERQGFSMQKLQPYAIEVKLRQQGRSHIPIKRAASTMVRYAPGAPDSVFNVHSDQCLVNLEWKFCKSRLMPGFICPHMESAVSAWSTVRREAAGRVYLRAVYAPQLSTRTRTRGVTGPSGALPVAGCSGPTCSHVHGAAAWSTGAQLDRGRQWRPIKV
jgi:hypothetical protein